MITSETWRPEPRRGSKALASKKSLTTNREKPIGWRMDYRRSERIKSGISLGSRTTFRVELATCRIDEAAGEADARAEERGYSICPVVNQNEIVLGLSGKRDWNTDSTASAEQVMDSAPTTVRPSDPLEKAKRLLNESDRGAVLVTDSDGRLLAALFGESKNEEPARKR